MTDHTIKAHMEIEGRLDLGKRRVSTRKDLINLIAQKSRDVDQIQCADGHVRFAERFLAALEAVFENFDPNVSDQQTDPNG